MSEHQQTQQSKESKPTFQKLAALVSQTQVSNPASIIQRARINPKSLTPADVLQLQRTIGNRAVGRLLSDIRNPSKVQQVPIQRQDILEEEEPFQGKIIKTIQRQEIPEEEEPLQGKFESNPEKEICPSCIQRQEIPEEEEPLQGKMHETIQRQEIPEEEEPLQGKMSETIQRQEISEEEEPLQGKFDTIQRLEPEEKEKLQMKSVVQRQEIPDEEEPIQGKMIGTIQRQEIPEEEEPLQTKRENNTGMPDNLKAGVESLSGIDLSDVRVHYNSDKPAEVGALAYTQGTNIHVALGQERHLPHEAWHVVQQAQGRVIPTFQMKGIEVNDDVELEKEADEIGEKVIGNNNIGDTPNSLYTNLMVPQKTNRSVCQLIPAFELFIKSDGEFINYLTEKLDSQYFGLEIESEPDATRLLSRYSSLREGTIKKIDEIENRRKDSIEASISASKLHKQTKLNEFSQFLSGFTRESDQGTLTKIVAAAETAADSTKRKKPSVRRNPYLGNALLINLRLGKEETKGELDPTTREQDTEKARRREEKTLMAPDDKWTWGINVAWLTALINKKSVFKLILSENKYESPVLNSLKNKQTKELFLKFVYNFYSTKTKQIRYSMRSFPDMPVLNINDDFWYGEHNRFSWLTEELAILLEKGYTLKEIGGNYYMVPENLDHSDPKFTERVSPETAQAGDDEFDEKLATKEGVISLFDD